MCHPDPLNVALAVRCKFPIYAKLYTLPALLAFWSAPRAQTIHKPLGSAHPTLPYPNQDAAQIYSESFLPQTLFSFPIKKNTVRKVDFCSSPILAEG